MVQLVLGFVCALLFFLTLAIRRVYYCVPTKELKRLARVQDPAGVQLYRAVAFDGSLAVLLWFLIGAFATASFVLFTLAMPAWGALVVIALELWLGFAWLAVALPRQISVQVAAFLSPSIAWLLSHTHTVLQPISRFIRKHHRVFEHTGLYEKQDIIELFQKQKEQADSRVLPEEVELLERVLAFGEKTASDIATPRAQVRVVSSTETIGPKLMDELHQSGLQHFPVSEASGKRVIGIVRLDDLVRAKQGGSVESVTDSNVAFVRDDFALTQVLQAFRQTKQQLLVVINNFEEFLGVVTLDRLFEEIVGSQNAEDDLAYDDRSAVAHHQPKPKEEIVQPEPATQENTEMSTPEASEVVE